jgi:hypothetical protein
MPTLSELFEFVNMKRALALNFGWLIHVSPEVHIASIKAGGLKPCRDAPIPTDLTGIVKSNHVLCLHPLGARACPPAVCNTVEYVENRKMVSFAVSAQELPEQINIDWSNAWEHVRSKIHHRPNMTSDELSLYLAIEFGSVVSYQVIEPYKLRVYCVGNPPTNPATWPNLLQTDEADIVRHY